MLALKAGAAARVVNPKKPSATLGWAKERFSNVYTDLRVQAMAVEDHAGRRIVWLGIDSCIVPRPLLSPGENSYHGWLETLHEVRHEKGIVAVGCDDSCDNPDDRLRRRRRRR